LVTFTPAGEDLVLHRFADHNGEAARVVRERHTGVPPLTALHRHFRAGLDRFDPVTGLNDHPEVLAFHRLVFTTPTLAGRLTQYMVDDEEALAGALGSGIEARLQAAQVLAVLRVLARTNWQKSRTGELPPMSTPRPSPTPNRHSLNCGLEPAALPMMPHDDRPRTAAPTRNASLTNWAAAPWTTCGATSSQGNGTSSTGTCAPSRSSSVRSG
jgi:hypothetical protein